MAKKIKIDFTNTKERSSFNTKHVPSGLYKAKVTAVLEKEAGDGVPMLVYTFVLEDKRYADRRFPYYCKLQQNQLWKLRDLLIAAGMSVPRKSVQIDPERIVNKTVVISLVDDSYNGIVRSTVDNVYAADILDDEEANSEESEENYTDADLDSEDEDIEFEEDDIELEEDDLDDLEVVEAPKKNPKKK